MKHDPTLFESWTPTSTCQVVSTGAAILGAAGIGAAASLFGGSKSAGAATDAAGAQVEAARIAAELGRETLGFQKEAFNATRGDQWDAFSFNRADTAPYRAAGTGALQTMNNMFLPGGHSMVQMQGRLNELRAEREKLMNAPTPIDPSVRAPVSSLGDGDGGGVSFSQANNPIFSGSGSSPASFEDFLASTKFGRDRGPEFDNSR